MILASVPTVYEEIERERERESSFEATDEKITREEYTLDWSQS